MKSLALIILVTALIPAAASAQSCIDYDDYLHWIATQNTNSLNDVAISGNYVYGVGNNTGLLVFDISDPYDPELLTSVTGAGEGRGLTIDDDLVYVAKGATGLAIFDISSPAAPVLVGYETLDCDTEAVDVQYPVAYVTGNSDEFQMVNVINPANPTGAGTTAFSGAGRDIKVDGYYVYIADSNTGLKVIEIGSSYDHTIVGQVSTADGAHGLYLYGDYAYLAGEYYLCVIDISNPHSPQLRSQIALDGQLNDVYRVGSVVYVAIEDLGVQVVNVQDPYNPYVIGTHCVLGGGFSLANSFGNLFLGGPFGLQIVAKGNSRSPATLSDATLPAVGTDMVADGGFVYIADGNSGLMILDVVSSSAPFAAGAAPTSGYAVSVDLAGTHAYVGSQGAGLDIFDVADPTDPAWLAGLDFAIVATEVQAAWPYLYIADNGYGLRVIDINTPTTPYQAGSLAVSGGLSNIDVVGDFVYGSSYSYELRVIDISNPTSPILRGSYPVPGYIQALDAADNTHVFLACDEDGLRVADVSSPTSPQLVANVLTSGAVNDVYVAPPYLYVSDRRAGMLVFDVTSPADPVPEGAIYIPGAEALAAVGSRAYISDQYRGFHVAPMQCGATISGVNLPAPVGASLSAYPNPFNPLTRISFSLVRDGRATVGVYDLTGRLLGILADGAYLAGDHTVVWTGTDAVGRAAPSGAYLLRLETGSGVATDKVMLIR